MMLAPISTPISAPQYHRTHRIVRSGLATADTISPINADIQTLGSMSPLMGATEPSNVRMLQVVSPEHKAHIHTNLRARSRA